jgi:hypothetical protein
MNTSRGIPNSSLTFALAFGALSAACTSSSDQVPPAESSWEVGVDVTNISPTQAQIDSGELYLGAYGLLGDRLGSGLGGGTPTGIHDDVYARTLVLRVGETVVSMTIMDMPGVSNRVIRAIGEAVAADTKIPRESILVGSTHSHSAPDLQGLWGHVPDDYKQDVIDKTAAGIAAAFRSLKPADLYVSKGTAPNRNRRGWEFTDTELTVLDAQAKDGSHIATLVNFAAHPVILGALNRQISRDFCGYTVDFLESKLGGKGLFFNGAVGDASPVAEGSEFEGCLQFGELVAQNAIDSMGTQTKVSPGIYRDFQSFPQEVTNAGFIALGRGGRLDYDFEQDAGAMSIDTQFAYFRLGKEVQGVAFPGEALTRTGLDIKAPQSAPFHLFLGLTTDSLGYFVKSDEWNTLTRTYEETVSTGQTAGDNAIRVLTELVAKDKGL